MNWDAIGAVGEILGALAVVGTLAYLATQMKQNSASLRRANEYAQASSIHETNALFTHVFAPLVENAEMATIYTKALDGEVLDKVETTRFTTFIKLYLAWAEDVFYQQETELGFAAHVDTAVFFNTIGPYIREHPFATPIAWPKWVSHLRSAASVILTTTRWPRPSMGYSRRK